MLRIVHLVPGWDILHVAHKSMELGAHDSDLVRSHASPSSSSSAVVIPPFLAILVSFNKVWSTTAVINVFSLQLCDHC